jgi:hypothetical protein
MVEETQAIARERERGNDFLLTVVRMGAWMIFRFVENFM